MSTFDWIIMLATTGFIVAYGIIKSRGSANMKDYLLAGKSLKWWTIGLSIMATQASAITFLSTPGQAYEDGMRFVQFYFGVPIAMVLISMIAIPIFSKLNVYTAYEYLEERFDLKTRTLGAILFLIGRSLAAGLTIVAPAIILSTLLGWDLEFTCIGIGAVVMLYTVSGGTKAVSKTQQQQMAIILVGMVLAGVIMVFKLPKGVSFGDAVDIAGKMDRLNLITMPDSWEDFIKDRYNILSGLIAGTFLMLSYFGTDQSQVQRYLGGKSVAEIRIGLLMNGMLKVPMQFLILFIGVMLFVFYQFNASPMFFNPAERTMVIESQFGQEYQELETAYQENAEARAKTWQAYADASGPRQEANKAELLVEARRLDTESKEIRENGIALIQKADPNANIRDRDRVFLSFVLNHLPKGLIGLLMAVIVAAAMSSTAAELNALASTSIVDIYRRMVKPDESERHYLNASMVMTFIWGLIAILFAITAGFFDNLIEYVNILGSLFYGTILGLFVVAFFRKQVKGTAVFIAACIAELTVVACYVLPIIAPNAFSWLDIGFLWYNLIGCMVVVIVAEFIQRFSK